MKTQDQTRYEIERLRKRMQETQEDAARYKEQGLFEIANGARLVASDLAMKIDALEWVLS